MGKVLKDLGKRTAKIVVSTGHVCFGVFQRPFGCQPLYSMLNLLFKKCKFWVACVSSEMLFVLFSAVSGLSVPTVHSALGPLAITTSAMTGRMAVPGIPGMPGHSVLLVSNLNPDVRATYRT